MGLFSKKSSKKNTINDRPKTNEEKRIEMMQRDPAAFVNKCFIALADLFAKRNGDFYLPIGIIDFWTYLHWFSRDIFDEADPDDAVVTDFCMYLSINEGYSEKDISATLDYMYDEVDRLDEMFGTPLSCEELMSFCGHAIDTLYYREDALLAIEFAQYLARSAQIVCEAFPKNK